jgi:uncharacterized membrane protein YkgB
MNDILIKVIQVIIALGLLNVWLIRANWSTAYRGGNAKNLREEFAVYGLSNFFCSFVGVLKIGSAILLLAGLWFPDLTFSAAILVSVLMLGAVAMHFKVSDPIKKTIPAALMLVLSLIVCGAT